MIQITLNVFLDARYITVDEFASRIRMNKFTVKHHMAKGRIPMRPKTGLREKVYVDMLAYTADTQIKPYLERIAYQLTHRTKGKFVQSFYQVQAIKETLGEENENLPHPNWN